MLLLEIPVIFVFFFLILQTLKNTKYLKQRRLLKWLLASASICLILNAPLGFLGSEYIQHYESKVNGCPSTYPYVAYIIALNIVGLLLLIFAGVLAYDSNNRWPVFLLIGASIMLVLLALGALLASSFCLTF